jgi:hypothetical protein
MEPRETPEEPEKMGKEQFKKDLDEQKKKLYM